MNRWEQVSSFIREHCFLRGDFTLRSGKKSNIYLDKYLLLSNSRMLNLTAEYLAGMLPEDTEVLAGLELGGAVIAPIVAQQKTIFRSDGGIDLAYVRKEKKQYGTCKQVEGFPVKGKKTWVVEDVITTGRSVLNAVKALENGGAKVEGVLCIWDRSSGESEVSKKGYKVISLVDNNHIRRSG